MTPDPPAARSFAELALALLENRFPWLGTDAPADGADTVEQLSDLHQTLREKAAEGRHGR